MRARVGIKTADDALSFSVNWRQGLNSFDIRLSSLFGISVAHIYSAEGADNLVIIDVPKKGRFMAGTASELLEVHTGLVLPIEFLRYWVRGKPAPDAEFEWQDSVLTQSGWQINYLDYKAGNPRRMRFTKTDIKVTLVVSEWQT